MGYFPFRDGIVRFISKFMERPGFRIFVPEPDLDPELGSVPDPER